MDWVQMKLHAPPWRRHCIMRSWSGSSLLLELNDVCDILTFSRAHLDGCIFLARLSQLADFHPSLDPYDTAWHSWPYSPSLSAHSDWESDILSWNEVVENTGTVIHVHCMHVLIIGHSEACVYTEDGASAEYTAPTCTTYMYTCIIIHYTSGAIYLKSVEWHTSRSSNHHLQGKISVSVSRLPSLFSPSPPVHVPNYGMISLEWGI